MKFSVFRNLLLGFTSVFLFASCDTGDDFVSYNYPDVAYGVLVNASPNSGDIYFYADNNLVNNYGLNYAEAKGYYTFYPGERILRIKGESGQELANDTITLSAHQYFTSFAVNTFDNIELMTYTDSLVQPSNNHARVRFINLSPDSGSIRIADGQTTVVTDLEFKEATSFIEIPGGSHNFNFTTESGAPLFTDTGVQLQSGRIYTIYTKGFVYPASGSNDSFSTEKLTLY